MQLAENDFSFEKKKCMQLTLVNLIMSQLLKLGRLSVTYDIPICMIQREAQNFHWTVVSRN